MQKFTQLTSKAMPLNIKDIDTDMIIPADFLTSTSREGYGENVFRRLRDQDENFPMNLDKYSNAEVIVAGDNFGCGSSREHAVWALHGAGYKAIISSSFSDIFFNNSGKNGLVLVQLPEEVTQKLLKDAESNDLEITVDLENQKVVTPNGEYSFDYDPFRKHCIVNGLDDIDYILSNQESVRTYEENMEDKTFVSVK